MQEDDALHVTFSVEDTGIGIKPEGKAELFSLFKKLNRGGGGGGGDSSFGGGATNKGEVAAQGGGGDGPSDYRRQGRGAGVGLAICQQLIELMGGDIRCESEYGRGSRFDVTVGLEKTLSTSSVNDECASSSSSQSRAAAAAASPLLNNAHGKPMPPPPPRRPPAAAQQVAAPSSAAAAAAAGGGGTSGGVGTGGGGAGAGAGAGGRRGGGGAPDPLRSMDVLVVEDNELNSWVVCNMLEAHGHRVQVVMPRPVSPLSSLLSRDHHS